MAADQGNYLLSQAAQLGPMAVALDLTLGSIEARRARSHPAAEAAD
jgi:hypothetical protein